MAKRKVVWTETAAKQRREILRYWTERNKSTSYAEKLIEVTRKASQSDHEKPGSI